MELKSFDDLLNTLRKDVEEYAKGYQEFINKNNDSFNGREQSTQIEFEQSFIDDWDNNIFNNDFSNISNCFKSKILSFTNDNFNTLGDNLEFLSILYSALVAHVEIKYQYFELKMPFGYKDKDKYDLKMQTYIKKYKNGKLNQLIEPKYSPYGTLKFIGVKVNRCLVNSHIKFISNVAREQNQYKKEMINELLKIIVCDCKIYLDEIRENTRLTNKNLFEFNQTIKEFSSPTKRKLIPKL